MFKKALLEQMGLVHRPKTRTSMVFLLLAPYFTVIQLPQMNKTNSLRDWVHVGAHGMYTCMYPCVFMCVEAKDNLGHLPLWFLT